MHSVPFTENELRQRHLYVKLGGLSSSPVSVVFLLLLMLL